MFFAPSKSLYTTQSQNKGVLQTSDHNQIKTKISNPSQEHSESSKALNQDFRDMDVLCSFKIKIEPKFGTFVY